MVQADFSATDRLGNIGRTRKNVSGPDGCCTASRNGMSSPELSKATPATCSFPAPKHLPS